MVSVTSRGGVSEESPDEQNHQAEQCNATQTSEGGVVGDTSKGGVSEESHSKQNHQAE